MTAKTRRISESEAKESKMDVSVTHSDFWNRTCHRAGDGLANEQPGASPRVAEVDPPGPKPDGIGPPPGAIQKNRTALLYLLDPVLEDASAALGADLNSSGVIFLISRLARRT